MIYYICLLIGSVIGYVTGVLCCVAKESDNFMRKIHNQKEKE